MVRFLVSRLAQTVVALLAVSVVVFLLARSSGNPVDVMLPVEATEEQRLEAIAALGLDRPLHEQYWIYLSDVAHGDFGTSIRTKVPAMQLVEARLLNSLLLASVALLFAVLIGLPLGVIAAVYRGSVWDHAVSTFALLGQSVPNFFLGIMAILLFSVALNLLPAQGASSWENYILPAVTMGWTTSAGITRLLRSGMLEVLGSEYVKFARSEGLPERSVIYKHALRNALLPVVTFIGLSYSILIGAAVSTEVVFGWPGLARLAYEAVLWRDFPVLQAVVMVWAVIIVGVNLVVDLSYGLLDPRTRH